MIFKEQSKSVDDIQDDSLSEDILSIDEEQKSVLIQSPFLSILSRLDHEEHEDVTDENYQS